MGRTSRWFRSLLGSKKPSGKPGRTGNNASFSSEALTAYPHGLDANKHAIVVAAATANAAEAALVAARAAAEVVRLTATSATAGRSRAAAAAADDDDDNYAGLEPRRHLAAVILQSAFRAYLARRALKALKGLVKLQALVRGHIVRKQSTYMLQRMQAMARIQARACAHRAYTSDSPHSSNKSFHSQNPDLASLKTIDHHSRAHGTRPNGSVLKRSVSKSNTKDNIGRGKTCNGSNWLDKWMEENAGNKLREASLTNEYCDDEKSDKILEVDTWKPHMDLNQNDQAFQRFQHVSAWNHNEPIYIRIDALSAHSTKTQRPTRSQSPLHFSKINSGKVNQTAVGVAENSSASSRPGSSSSRRGPSIPARSECLPSFYSNYMGLPNYMTYTESSQAKVRSQSAPRQRLNSERPGALKRYVHGYWDEETISVKGWPLHANFSTIAYPGTDSFEKFGYA